MITLQKMFKDLFLFSTSSFLICATFIQAQEPTRFINDKTYFQQDSIWYVQSSVTGENFKVNTNSITVNLNNSATFNDLEVLVNKIGVEIKRKNILGYIDLFVPLEKDIFHLWELLNNSGLFESVEINSFGKLLFSPLSSQTPNDPDYELQHHLNHQDFPDINAPEGWDLCNNYGEGIIIAILDDGFDWEHPDLIDNVWSSVGWDFIEDLPILESVIPKKKKHGTKVAGIVGASTNNLTGVSGVAGGWYASQAGSQIMSVVLGTIFYIDDEIVDDAIIYAVLSGAKILNFTWNGQQTSAIDAAIDFAYNARGCLIFAAAGNTSSSSSVWYPANNNNVIAVAGIRKNWTHYGNTGSQLEIAAPAEALYTTSYHHIDGPTYDGSEGGTSGSTPMVSGAAALLWADYPALTNFDIRRILKETAFTSFSNYNQLHFGEGILKVDDVLLYAQNMPIKPSGVTISAPIGGNPTTSWTAVPGADYYNIYRSGPNEGMLLYKIGNTTNTSFTDYNITVVNPKFALYTYNYRVTAVDNGYESPISSSVSCGSNNMQKITKNETTQSQIQTIDTVYNSTGRITSIELIKNKPDEIIILDESIGVVKSIDFGQTWVSALYDTTTPELYDISFDQKNTQVGFSAGFEGLYKTVDGGYNWFNTNQLEFMYIVDVNPYSSNIIFAQKAGDSGFGPFDLYRSTDYGETWEDSSIDRFILDPQFHSTNDSIAYGFNSYNILRTANLGNSWESKKTSNNQFTAMSLNKNNPGTLYASERGFFYKTNNEGNNWSEIGSALRVIIPSFKIRSILLDDSISGRIYVGLAEGLFLTEDDGLHWKQIYNDPVYLIKADEETPRNIYFTTNYERTAIRLVDTLTVTVINESNTVQPKRYFLFQNYPNPFNPTTTINYLLKNKSSVQLTIYDISGREIKTLVNQNQNPGKHSITFNATGLASGIYIYKLKAGSFEQNRKMVLLR